MGLPKNVVYQFVDDPRWDELEVDNAGALTFKKGDVLTKGERQWQVIKTQWELSDEESKRMPTL
jgi:hypothetical protein